MTEELIAATNKKNGEDRSVSSADRLLTPGSDKAGNLDKAALLPAPDGVPLLEAGASASENRGIGECHVYKNTCNTLGRIWNELAASRKSKD